MVKAIKLKPAGRGLCDDPDAGLVGFVARTYRRIDRNNDSDQFRHIAMCRPSGIFDARSIPQSARHIIEDLGVELLATEPGSFVFPNDLFEKRRSQISPVVVAEVNNGGAMVEATVRVVDANVSYKAVHASRGKVVRAQPVAALYEQSRIHHVGAFPALEDQMCAFTTDFDRAAAGFSPDRCDALVWAFSELMVEPMASWGVYEATRRQAEALVKAKAAAIEAAWPKSEPAPGSMEYQALHPEWKPQQEE